MKSNGRAISAFDSSVSDSVSGVGDLATTSPAQVVARKPKLYRLTEFLFGTKSVKLNTSVRQKSGSLDICLTSERCRRPADAAASVISASVATSAAQPRRSESRILSFLGARVNDCTPQPSSPPGLVELRQSSPGNKSRPQLQSSPRPQGPCDSLSSAASGESTLCTPTTTALNFSCGTSSSCADNKPSPLPRCVDSAAIQILDPSGAPEDLKPDPCLYKDQDLWYDNDILISTVNSSSSGNGANFVRQRLVESGGAVVQLKADVTADTPAAGGSVAPLRRPHVTLKNQLLGLDPAAAAATAMAFSLQPARPPPWAQPVPQLRHPMHTQLLATSAAAPEAMRRLHWYLEDYVVDRRLYRSPTASVYSATCIRSGLPVALKVYSLAHVPGNVVHMLRREVEIQTMLVHRNIVKLYGAFQDFAAQQLILVQEFACNGSLVGVHRALCCRMSERQARVLALRPLLEAMSYFHSLGIVHRDIKPDNILFGNDWRLLLADFGVAIDITAERAVTRAGTVGYMAPEVERCPIKMLPEDNKLDPSLSYTTAADVWAVGCLAYLLLLGFPPYINANNLNGHHNHNHNHCHANTDGTEGTPTAAAEPHGSGAAFAATPAASTTCRSRTLTFPPSTSPLARDFITAALADRPEDRPTARQLLQHPWMQQPPAPSSFDRTVGPNTG